MSDDSDMDTDTEQPTPRQLSKPERIFNEIYTFIDNQADDGEKDNKVARFLLRYVEHEGVFTTVRYTRTDTELARELWFTYSLLKSAATAYFVSLAWYAKKHPPADVEFYAGLHIDVYNAYREALAPRLEDGSIDLTTDTSMQRRFYALVPQRELEIIGVSEDDLSELDEIVDRIDPLYVQLRAIGQMAVPDDEDPAPSVLFPPPNSSTVYYETDTGGRLFNWAKQ